MSVQALANDVTEINLYDAIGPWGVSASDFRAALAEVDTGTIRLNINSPGGDVFDGLAIFSDLVDHPATVEVRVTGLAASAASFIAMAGDKISIAEHAFFMIHNSSGGVYGTRHDMADTAKVLAKIDSQMAAIYADRTGQKESDLADMMDAETWLTADEAIEYGFAEDAYQDEEQTARAAFDLSKFRNVPRALKAKGPSAKAKTDKPAHIAPDKPVQSFASLAAELEKLNALITAEISPH